MNDYNAGYVAGIEEILHLIEISKYRPYDATNLAENSDPGEGYSRQWYDGREDAITKLYYLFRSLGV